MMGRPGVADAAPVERIREQRAWYWYDWANSGYVTTVATVLFAPYLISVAERDACGYVSDDPPRLHPEHPCSGAVGLPRVAAVLRRDRRDLVSALVLPVVGAAADRSARKPHGDGPVRLAWARSQPRSMFFVAGDELAARRLLMFVTNIASARSLVVYDAILSRSPHPTSGTGSRPGAGRSATSAAACSSWSTWRGDAARLGRASTETAVRISLLSAGIWWAAFTIIPCRGIRDRPPVDVVPEQGAWSGRASASLATLRDLRNYPVTLTFLVAYLFYNDGIQTVIASASTYGEKELGFETEVLIATILLVQFVAFGGALLFGRLAESATAPRKVVLVGPGLWIAHRARSPTSCRSRTSRCSWRWRAASGSSWAAPRRCPGRFFSQLIPRGREAEYFSLYQACERGTSWLGTLVFGLVHQLDRLLPAGDHRADGLLRRRRLLLRGWTRARGIAEAGNQPPAVV